MIFEGFEDWNAFFKEHTALIKKLEEKLEFGSEKEQQEALYAYSVLQQEAKKGLEQHLKKMNLTREEAVKNQKEVEKEIVDQEMEKHFIEFDQSLKKIKSLIRKKTRGK